MLPGVFVHPGSARDLPTLARAAMHTGPAAVITGAAAAALTYWPELARALPLGAVKVRELTSALELTPSRPGNALRRRLVRDVKTEGCSPLERTGHRYLRRAAIDGWVANRGILVLGQRARPDVRFRARKLVLEFDGFAFHSSRAAFEHDRGRGNLFALDGYLVLHFTDRTLQDSATFIRQVRRGLRIAAPY